MVEDVWEYPAELRMTSSRDSLLLIDQTPESDGMISTGLLQLGSSKWLL